MCGCVANLSKHCLYQCKCEIGKLTANWNLKFSLLMLHLVRVHACSVVSVFPLFFCAEKASAKAMNETVHPCVILVSGWPAVTPHLCIIYHHTYTHTCRIWKLCVCGGMFSNLKITCYSSPFSNCTLLEAPQSSHYCKCTIHTGMNGLHLLCYGTVR